MPAVESTVEHDVLTAVPRLLVELPSPTRVFFANLVDLFFRRQSSLELDCAPGEFWPDVFVKRSLPWRRFLQSTVYHVMAGLLLISFTRLFAVPPRVIATPMFEHSQVVYYSAPDLLPQLDTREPSSVHARKAEPEYSRQPIISVPAEADNRVQTVVTPPKVKLKRDVALPNMVVWADEKQPQLAIPDAPLTPAAEFRRMPQVENAVVSPPPDATQVIPHRNAPAMQNSVVAPPPELRNSNSSTAFQGLQPVLIAPPPSVQSAPARAIGEMDIGPSAVIAPAPQLPIAAQRTAQVGKLSAAGAPVVAPPPAVSGAGSSVARPRILALNLHPAVGAPPQSAAGNRRGTFAATSEGHAGASGSPGSAASTAEGGLGTNRINNKSDLPSGLYIGKTAEVTSPVAGSPNKAAGSVNPRLMGSIRPPGLSASSSPSAERAPKLTEAEKSVFAGRQFYSLTLNMPNLNSAGGSWIIRFAEKNRAVRREDSALSPNLSQPIATKKVDPAYPLQLMRENVAGTVILYAVIHADGSVGDVRILRGVDERLDRFAAEAVEKWEFQPARRDGDPVDVEATFQIPFRPSRVGTNF